MIRYLLVVSYHLTVSVPGLPSETVCRELGHQIIESWHPEREAISHINPPSLDCYPYRPERGDFK